MNDAEFQDRFNDILNVFHQDVRLLEEKPLEYALASYIRYIERHSGKKIHINFSVALLRHSASATKVFPNSVVHIFIHEHYRTVKCGDPCYHSACCLIAHELAHLILCHSHQYEAFRAQMADRAECEDIQALMEILDLEADIYGTILAIARAPVLEREYYDNRHMFVMGKLYAQTFFSEPFRNGGFLKVRDMLEQRGEIIPPSKILTPILEKELLNCLGNDDRVMGEQSKELANRIVHSYRSTGIVRRP